MSLRKQAISGGKWASVSSLGLIGLQLFQVWILSHILSSEEFGLYAMVMIVVQIVLQFADAGIGAAIVQRQDVTQDELSSLYWLNVGFGVGLAMIMAAGSPLVADFFTETRLTSLIRLAAAALAVMSFGQQYQYLLQKALDFRKLALAELFSSALGVGVSIISAYRGHGVSAFLHGMMVNFSLRSLLFLLAGRRHHTPRLRFRQMDLKGYIRYGAFLSGQNLVNILSGRIDSIIIGRTLGPEALGVYYFSQQSTSQVYQRLTAIVSRVAFPVFSKLQKDSAAIEGGFRGMTHVLCLMVFPFMAGLLVVTDEVLRLFFQQNWWSAGPVIRMLILVMLIRTSITSVGVLLMAKARNDIGLYANIVILLISTLLMVTGSKWGLSGVIWGLLISSMLGFVGWLWIMGKYLGISPRSLLKALWLPIWASAAMAFAAWVVLGVAVEMDFPTGSGVFITVIVGSLVYIFLTIGMHARLRAELWELLGANFSR